MHPDKALPNLEFFRRTFREKMCESGVASLREIDNIIATLGNFCRVGGIWTTSKG